MVIYLGICAGGPAAEDQQWGRETMRQNVSRKWGGWARDNPLDFPLFSPGPALGRLAMCSQLLRVRGCMCRTYHQPMIALHWLRGPITLRAAAVRLGARTQEIICYLEIRIQ